MAKFCFFTSVGRDNYEVIVYRRANTLYKAGYETYFLVNDEKGDEIIENTRVISTGVSSGGYLKRILINPYRTYRKLIKVDADVYQTYSIDMLIVCYLLKKKGKKVIFDLREGHPYTYYLKSKKPKWLNTIIVFIMAMWMKFFLKHVNATLTVSEGIQKTLQNWGINKQYLIGNFPEVNWEYNLTYEDYCNRENTIIYYGSIYRISRQEIFLDALVKVPNVNYLLAGKFEYQDYQEQIQRHPYWSNVNFKAGFSRIELPNLLSKATISNVLRDFSKTNSQCGSMGIIKMFESMEAALPLICSNVELYRELMKEYPCGILVDANDEKEIEKAILYLTNHKEKAYKMGQIGRKAVIEKYSWDAISSQYLQIVSNLL